MKLAVITPTIPGREEMLKIALSTIEKEMGAGKIGHFLCPGPDNASAKYNRMLCRAKTAGFTHFFPLSDDDALRAGWLEAHLAGLEQNPEADFVYGDIIAMDKDGVGLHIWTPPAFSNTKLLREPTLPGVGIISMDVWSRAGGYEHVPYGADWLMFAKASPLSVVRIPGAWYCHRLWENTETKEGDREPLHTALAKIRAERGMDV